MHEILCLYEISALDMTADNLVNIVEEKLFGSIIDLYVTRENIKPQKKIKLSRPPIDKNLINIGY